jgi:uncharacterized membrane protein
MANTILGIFDDPVAARRAMDELRASALDLHDISVISRSGEGATDGEHLGAGEGAAIGAVWGGLVGLAALLIPGVGPFVAGGALFAALTGAATGAVVGGVAGALMDSAGLSEEEARNYEAQVHGGKTLLAVKARDEDALTVRRILVNAGAISLRDNQTDITGRNAPVNIATDNVAGRSIAQELEAGLTGARTVAGTQPAAPSVPNTTLVGLPGIYEAPETRVGQPDRGIYDMPTLMKDADTAAAAQSETTNIAAGTEDPSREDQSSPGDPDRAIVTEGWDRIGYAGDRQGEALTPPAPDESEAEETARRSSRAQSSDK